MRGVGFGDGDSEPEVRFCRAPRTGELSLAETVTPEQFKTSVSGLEPGTYIGCEPALEYGVLEQIFTEIKHHWLIAF